MWARRASERASKPGRISKMGCKSETASDAAQKLLLPSKQTTRTHTQTRPFTLQSSNGNPHEERYLRFHADMHAWTSQTTSSRTISLCYSFPLVFYNIAGRILVQRARGAEALWVLLIFKANQHASITDLLHHCSLIIHTEGTRL